MIHDQNRNHDQSQEQIFQSKKEKKRKEKD